jgi:signal transduction histidine kinase
MPRRRTKSRADHDREVADLRHQLDERTREGRAVFRQLVTTQERERAQLARDLHDLLGQQMTALRLAIDSLRAISWPIPQLAEQAARAEESARNVDRAIDELTLGLRSEPLDSLGIAAAIEQLVTEWAERNRIVADCGVGQLDGQRFDPEIEINLFRIAQEALHNVLKHAQATRVSVSLERRLNRLQLVIEDNGRGIEPAVARTPPDGKFGLIGMRERAALLGGTVEIESSRGRGTTIFVRVPLAETSQGDD